MKTKKKKNPQDATLRNIRALKKRVRTLEVTVVKITRVLAKLFKELGIK